MEGETRQDGSLGSRTLRPLWQDSGKTRPGRVCDWEAAIRDPPLPYTARLQAPAGLLPLLLAWGMDTQHLDRAFLIPTLGAQSIYSAQLTLNKTLSRDNPLLSLALNLLIPFLFIGQGEG